MAGQYHRHDHFSLQLTFVLRSLIEHYPHFNARLRESVRALIGEEVEKTIELGMAKDGSGVGGEFTLVRNRSNIV